MKRLLVRTALLAMVSGLGYVGAMQAYKGFGPRAAAPPEGSVDPAAAAAAAQPDMAALKPIPLSSGDGNSADQADANAQPPAGDRYAAADRFAANDRYAQASDRYAAPQDRYAAGDRYAEQSGATAADPFGGRQPARVPLDERPAGAEDPRASRSDPFGLANQNAPAGPAEVDPAVPAGFTPDVASDAVVGGNSPTAEPRRLAPIENSRPLAEVAQPMAPPDTVGGGRPLKDDMTRPASADGNGPPENLFAGASRGGHGAPLDPSPPVAGSGRPGSQQLEGAQTPALAIEKTAPAEIQVGKPAVFLIKVRNVGAVVAQGVEVHDDVPQGTQFVSSTPPAAPDAAGRIVWTLGLLKPGDEALIQLQLLPVAEGEIGSLATVHFRAEASVRTRSTRPALALQVTVPPRVMIGDDLTMKIRVTNPGSGTANNVVLTENVPAELKHNAGNELELEIGSLKPGEGRDLELTLTAAKAGQVVNLLSAHGDDNLRAEDRTELDVLAPALKLALTTPKKRYLERKATFTIGVSNPGTAVAKDVELVATLPKGMKFVEANNLGQYDSAAQTVRWSLEELPPQETGSVSVTAIPLEPGTHKLQVRAVARQGLSDNVEETVAVDGIAAIMFELVDVQDPVEVNGQATYEIHLVNQGSKAAGNVRIVALLPPEMRPLGAEGPVRFTIDGQRVLFEPLGQLAAKADTTYTIKAQALQAGDSRIRVQLLSDDIRVPITKEESTRVFADE